MKFSSVVSLLATATTLASANPIYKRIDSLNSTVLGGLNSTGVVGGNNGTVWNNGTNGTNGTTPGVVPGILPGHNQTDASKKLKLIVTGGWVPVEISQMEDVVVETVYNTSSVLNITQLYNVGRVANQSLAEDQFKGVVILGNPNNLESLGFFSTIVLNTEKGVVVSGNAIAGLKVANDTGVISRGPLVVDKKQVFSGGVFPTYSPVGFYDPKSNASVKWLYSSNQPIVASNTSALRTTYTNFTNIEAVSNSSTAPLIPIVYEGSYSQEIFQSLGQVLQGLVIVSSGHGPSNSSSSVALPAVPIVYATEGTVTKFIDQSAIPAGAIAGGILTPLQAQILLSVSLANGVTEASSLSTVFS